MTGARSHDESARQRAPSRVLLATDLSHRTDRALDRAVQLAREWDAALLVVHAIEQEVDDSYDPHSRHHSWSWRGGDPAAEARKRLRRDLVDEGTGLEIDVHVEEGTPAEVVLRAAEGYGAELIVTGVARAETLGRLWLGSTVDRLARRSPVPLLIARDRVFGPYGDVVVATDFAASSRAALEVAAAFFPAARLHLFHGYDLPFAGYLGRAEIDRQLQTLGEEAVQGFLAETDLGSVDPASVQHTVEHGSPAALLREFAASSTRHLVVIGSEGGGLARELLIGSTSRKIIDAVPGDVLLVPASHGGGDAPPA